MVTMTTKAVVGVLAMAVALGTIKLEAQLRATAADPLASGKATWEDDGQTLKFSCEVEDVTGAAGDVLSVEVRGIGQVGTLTIDEFGFGDLNLEGPDVPVMEAGDRVVVRKDGTPILRGRLRVVN